MLPLPHALRSILDAPKTVNVSDYVGVSARVTAVTQEHSSPQLPSSLYSGVDMRRFFLVHPARHLIPPPHSLALLL